MVIYRNVMVSFCGLFLNQVGFSEDLPAEKLDDAAHQELGTWQEYMTIASRSGTQGEDAIYRMAPWRSGWPEPLDSSSAQFFLKGAGDFCGVRHVILICLRGMAIY